ncbi:MAG TPA: hypothetical protein PK208_12695 [Fibrobacteria bacterium]|nr:hypothetical protein [Fibrobacteria bacterium]
MAPTVPDPPRMAPASTVKALEVEDPFTRRVPAPTVVAPPWVLVPESVKVPVPDFASASVPDVFWIVPENVVLELSPPAASVYVPEPLVLSTIPDPARDPTTPLWAFMSSVPFTVRALPEGSALSMP